MKLAIKLIIISLFISGCQNHNDENRNEIIKFHFRDLHEINKVKLSDLGFVDVEYIPLETNSECVVSGIKEIKFGNGFLLVKYYNTILEFRNDGSFITKIGTEGRGPNEFLVANDVEIDQKNQNIYLVSAWQKKFNVYSEQGKFLRTFNCPLNTTDFRFAEDGILCFNANITGNVDTSFYLIDSNGVILKSFPNNYRWRRDQFNTALFKYENVFYSFNKRIYKKEIYSDTVYVLENGNFVPHFVIEHGDKLLTVEARSNHSPEFLFEYFIDQNNLFEFGDYIYYEFMYDFKVGGNNVLRGFIASKKNNFQTIINSQSGIINDLDGGPNIHPITIKDDNTIVGWVDALQLKNHISSVAFINSNPKYPENKNELVKLAQRLAETDNPVLILARVE